MSTEKELKPSQYEKEKEKALSLMLAEDRSRDDAEYGFNEAWYYQAHRIHTMQKEIDALRLSLSGKTQHDQVEEYKKGLREKIEKQKQITSGYEPEDTYEKGDQAGTYSALIWMETLINEP